MKDKKSNLESDLSNKRLEWVNPENQLADQPDFNKGRVDLATKGLKVELVGQNKDLSEELEKLREVNNNLHSELKKSESKESLLEEKIARLELNLQSKIQQDEKKTLKSDDLSRGIMQEPVEVPEIKEASTTLVENQGSPTGEKVYRVKIRFKSGR